MRTELTLSALVRQLTVNCGDMLDACQKTGVSVQFVKLWRRDDAEVDKQLTEAENIGVQGLYSAAVQRGVVGVEEDVYFKGIVVGQKKVYSDSLLTTLLKGKLADFKKEDSAAANVQVNVAIMPRADNYQQWLEMKQATVASTAEKIPALAPPIDVEYEEIRQPVEKLPNIL